MVGIRKHYRIFWKSESSDASQSQATGEILVVARFLDIVLIMYFITTSRGRQRVVNVRLVRFINLLDI